MSDVLIEETIKPSLKRFIKLRLSISINLPFRVQFVQLTNISGFFCTLQRSGPLQIWHLSRSSLPIFGTGGVVSIGGLTSTLSPSSFTSVISSADSSLELLVSYEQKKMAKKKLVNFR